MEYTIHGHAREALVNREIDLDLLDFVLQNPEQIIPQPDGRTIYQSRFRTQSGKEHLLRVVVDLNENPPLVITVIPTIKIKKYWKS